MMLLCDRQTTRLFAPFSPCAVCINGRMDWCWTHGPNGPLALPPQLSGIADEVPAAAQVAAAEASDLEQSMMMTKEMGFDPGRSRADFEQVLSPGTPYQHVSLGCFA